MQPHKSEYWLFSKIKNWKAFVVRVSLVGQLILAAVEHRHPQRHILSVDEKTGIQALQRLQGEAPKSKGGHRRKEYEYTRHGTTSLMAAFDVAEGNISNQRIHPTRTEEDFAKFIEETVNLFPKEDEIVFLADQLNTHKSETLVVYITELINCNKNLGKKGRSGILKNMKSRKDFLENTAHRVRFIFTPKDCSWLNPIENWFAKLQRHVIKNGDFSCVKELEDKIKDYIDFYNRCLSKPLNWKFKGFFKDKQLHNIKVSKT